MCDHCSKVSGQKGYGGQVTCKCEPAKGDKKNGDKDKDSGGCCGKKAKEAAGGCCKSGCCADTKKETKSGGGCCAGN